MTQKIVECKYQYKELQEFTGLLWSNIHGDRETPQKIFLII